MQKVSVIIPIYNIENYLPQCLDSVVNQTYKNLEIICIDDGSTDNSLKILMSYAESDERFVVFHQKNQGVSAARNKGIDIASGYYVAFIDPDDWLENNAIEDAVEKLESEKADVVCFSHKFIKGDEATYNLEKFNLTQKYRTKFLNNEEVFPFTNVVWDKVYKADFIKSKDIKFPLHIHPCEDLIWGLNFFFYRPKTAFLPLYLYNYRIDRKNCAMNHKKVHFKNQMNALKILLKSDFYKQANKEYKKVCVEKVIGGFKFFYDITEDKKTRFVYTMQTRSFLPYIITNIPWYTLNNSINFKYLVKISRKIYYLDKIFSVKNAYNHGQNVKHKVINAFGLKIQIKVKNG